MQSIPLRTSPHVETLSAAGLPVLASRTDHRDALIYWHGFPGPFSAVPDQEPRLADQVFDLASARHDFYYPLYTSKRFDFWDSVQLGKPLIDFVRARKAYTSLTVVGQSWGAVIALNGYDPRSIKKLILVTPFLAIPTGPTARRVLDQYQTTYPTVLPDPLETYEAQIARIATERSPLDILKRSLGDVAVFAAAADVVVPIDAVRAVIPASVRMIVLEGQGHDVEDRVRFRELFGAELDR